MSTQTTDFLSLDEFEALLGTFSKAPTARRNRTLVLTMLEAGARVSEALSLRWEDVRFPTAGKPGEVIIRKGKRGKTRRVPLAPRLAEALQAWKDSRPKALCRCKLVFPTLDGDPMNRRYVYAMLRRKAIAALGESRGAEIHPHTLRHTFGNWLRQAGKDARTIADLMGHTKIQLTLEFYFRSTKADREGAIADTFKAEDQAPPFPSDSDPDIDALMKILGITPEMTSSQRIDILAAALKAKSKPNQRGTGK